MMNIQEIRSTWKGHYDFARWLVNKVKPKVIVDLGVYHGFSTFTFASLGYGKVYAIDNFSIKGSYDMSFWLGLVFFSITIPFMLFVRRQRVQEVSL